MASLLLVLFPRQVNNLSLAPLFHKRNKDGCILGTELYRFETECEVRVHVGHSKLETTGKI